jgi:hypothetical protein
MMWHMQEIAGALLKFSTEYDLFRKAQNDAMEAILAQHYEKQMLDLEARLRAELGNTCNSTKKHIIDDILTQRCPRCRVAFLDFNGCMAVTCGNCSAAFCAICTADCGTDAHAHVAKCRWAGNTVFASFDDIHFLVNKWRRHKILEALSGMPPHLKGRVICDLSIELHNVGLKADDLKQEM